VCTAIPRGFAFNILLQNCIERQAVYERKLFGTWHDGAADGEARMNARFSKRQARVNAMKA
jgi:hypothetical protein